MRIIKLAFLSLVFFSLLITGISFFFPSRVRLSKAINIKTTPEQVWQQVDDIRNWAAWNPLFSNTGNKKTEYPDTGNGIWTSIRVESTIFRIKSKTADEHTAEMQSGNHRPVVSGWVCITNPAIDSLTVQWYMDFQLHWYPWEKFSSLMLEKNYGPSMERGLTNLKNLLEKK